MWKVRLELCENAHLAVLRAALPASVVRIQAVDVLEGRDKGFLEQTGRFVRILVRAALRLGDDRVDHAELEAVGGVGLEGGRSLAGFSRVAPQDRRASLRRDHGVD